MRFNDVTSFIQRILLCRAWDRVRKTRRAGIQQRSNEHRRVDEEDRGTVRPQQDLEPMEGASSLERSCQSPNSITFSKYSYVTSNFLVDCLHTLWKYDSMMTCKTPAMTAVFFEVSVNVLFHSPLERECTGPYISLLSCSGDMLVLGVNVSCVSVCRSKCPKNIVTRAMGSLRAKPTISRETHRSPHTKPGTHVAHLVLSHVWGGNYRIDRI